MLQYGVCTWIFGGEPLNQTAARLVRLGYDGVELMGDLTLFKPKEVNSIMSDHGLRILSVTPENEDILHPDSAVRKQGIDYYLRLLEFGKAINAPIVCCHGAVGRIRPVTTYEAEWQLYVDAVRKIGQRAEELDINVVMEVLNRYEAHFLLTSDEAVRFVTEVGSPRVKILLDAYHMNIEEKDLCSAIHHAGQNLGLFHVADSNRQAVGRGHTNFIPVFRALKDIGYAGSVIVENVAPGPDPFTALKGDDPVSWLETYLDESLRLMRLYEAVS
jgi:D-psicose/D-tagatose/L-ribulose 3-epimerase